jgi:hypothetical protein
MRERVDLKSPVREYRPPGSVRGAPGNRRPYRDVIESPTGTRVPPLSFAAATDFPSVRLSRSGVLQLPMTIFQSSIIN